MSDNLLAFTAILLPAILASNAASAAPPKVKIYESGNQKCIESNGVPNHSIGQFTNAGNPNSFKTQNQKFCFPANPARQARPTHGTPIVGVALNGIVIRPGTADWYDASSPRGFSRDRSSGWNLEGMGSAQSLGIDQNNAHVDNRGTYHYHGPPPASVSKGSLVGYAADGFEIHYVGKSAKPSYILKSGTRPTAPGGAYDGRFVEDWQFAKGLGNLDQCNGAKMNGRYVYFATDGYPFFPRCHWGKVSDDFKRPGGSRPTPVGAGHRRTPQGGQGGPLAAAAAELGVSERQLADAVGPPPPNFKRAAQKLGIPEATLREVMRRHRPR